MKQYKHTGQPPSDKTFSCHCVGPQNGEPLCPCEMKSLKKIDGRWVKITDYGKVKD